MIHLMILRIVATFALLLQTSFINIEAHSPHDVVSALTSIPSSEVVFAVVRGWLLKSIDGGLSWTYSAKGFSCVDETCGKDTETLLIASPSYNFDSTVFFGTKKYGLQRSTDGGTNWHGLEDGLFQHCLGKGHVSVSPNFGRDKLILVAGKDINSGQHMLYRSTDSGNSFAAVELISGERGRLKDCFTLFSATPQLHFMGTHDGSVWVSKDAGLTWKIVPGENDISSPILMIAGKSSIRDDKELYLQDLYILTDTALKMAYLQHQADTFKWAGSKTLKTPSKDMKFSNIFIHEHTIDSDISLFLLQAGCRTNPDCDQDMFVSNNAGNTFTRAKPRQLTVHVNDKHVPGDDTAAHFNLEEFSDVHSVKGKSIVFLGTFAGVFRSDDDGNTWEFLDTISHQITALAVAKIQEEEGQYFVNFCTYSEGCYGGHISITGLVESTIKPQIPKKGQNRYRNVALSPNYNQDGLIFRTDGTNKGEVLLRTADNFVSQAVSITLPALNDKEETVVHTILVSPHFDQDKRIFISGHNIGLAVSNDSGKTFATLWDPRTVQPFGTATKCVLSPHFSTDGIIGCLVDDYIEVGKKFYTKYKANVYMSNNYGETWQKLTNNPQPWFNLEAISSTRNGNVSVSLVSMSSDELYIWTSNEHSWKLLEHKFEAKSYSTNGLRSSPDGKCLLVAFHIGGIGQLCDFHSDSMNFKTTNVVNVVQDYQIMKVGFDIRKNWLRGIGEAFAYSPKYGIDSVVFAASFNSLFVSTDGGYIWKEVYRLGNNMNFAHQHDPVGDSGTSVSHNSSHDVWNHTLHRGSTVHYAHHYNAVDKSGTTSTSHVFSNDIWKQPIILGLILISMTLAFTLRRTHFFLRRRGLKKHWGKE